MEYAFEKNRLAAKGLPENTKLIKEKAQGSKNSEKERTKRAKPLVLSTKFPTTNAASVNIGEEWRRTVETSLSLENRLMAFPFKK